MLIARTSLRIRRGAFVFATLAAIALMFAGCGRSTPASPESAFRAFRDALRYGANEAAWAMLTPRAQSTLAADDTDAPWRSLRVAWVPAEADIESLERVSIDEAGAVLRVTTYHGDSHEVALVRGEEAWLIDLDLTRVADADDSAQDGGAPDPAPSSEDGASQPPGAPTDTATEPVDGP